MGAPRLRIDGHIPHAGHVERQTAFGYGGAGDIVASALYAEAQPVITGESDRRGHVMSRVRLAISGAARPGKRAISRATVE